MLGAIIERAGVGIAKSAMSATDEELSSGKRIISVLAGAYVFRRGLKNITKKPFFALQEVALGGYLLYTGITGESPLGREVTKNKKYFSARNEDNNVNPDSYYRNRLERAR